jgi:fermentation-respiration switch protein FrsA (DUF1100 family)
MMSANRNHAAPAGRAGWLLLLVALLTGCAHSFFYLPTLVFYDTPKRVGLSFEQVLFSSYDGTRLVGWFFPASGYSDSRNAKGTVVHFHDNARNISAHWQYVEWLPRRGFNLFVFDYRGFGASEGIPDPKGVFEDSNSALDYVRSRPDVNPDQLVLLGQSIGGANAIAVIGSGNRKGVKAIVIEATFYSYSSIASDKISWAGGLMDDTYSPERYIANLSPIPFLLLHGTADSVIPLPHATKLFGKANEPKRLIAVEGGRHIEAFTPRFGTTYMDIVSVFLDEACQQRPR